MPIGSLNCAGATHNGGLTSGYAASGVSSVISYTGGDGSAYSGQTVASTGVTGLTATLAAGNFAVGAGSLTYTITGTPSAGGTASFAITVGGRTCTLTRTVGTISLAKASSYFVCSVYDQDFLPYTIPVVPATTNTQAADGANEAVAVNVQGSITTAGVAVKIPVAATGSGTLPAYSTTITIPAALTEDGIGRDLTLSWPSQAFTAATTSINATIASVGGTFNAKKLDVNAGVGNDSKGVLMGTFAYPAGNSGSYQVRVISGIPDKMFGLADNTGNTTTHKMLYVPIVAEDGKVWLNNNLGAHYSNINHAAFNIGQQATSATDYLAYGSLFQWGRKPDGHELITFTSGSSGTPVNGMTSTLSNTPAHALFITNIISPYDWRASMDDTLWATASSANNPCPAGFRVPTSAEFTTLASAANVTERVTAAASLLKITNPGARNAPDGSMGNVGNIGYYCTSTPFGSNSYNFYFGGSVYVNTLSRGTGLTVRCLKD